MHLTRLQIERPRDQTIELTLTTGLNVVDLDAEELELVGEALRQLFSGSTSFGRAWMAVEDIEIEITPEMAHLLPASVAQPVVELATMATESGPTLTAVRSALELLDVVPPRLVPVDVDAALAVTRDEHDMIVHRAERTLQAALEASHAARERRDLIHETTFPALTASPGRLWNRRRDRLAAEARAARDHVDHCLDLAEAALAQAEVELHDVRHRTSGAAETRELVARDYCLSLRRQVFRGGSLLDADSRALRTALDVLRPIDDRRLSRDPLTDAALWLEHQESRHVDDLLLARAARNCLPHPVLGVVPLIVDPAGDSVAIGLRRTVDELTPELQVIHLGRLDG